jgi:hypothetical protein
MLSSMKSKNKRELEKYWAEQAAKKAKVAKKKSGIQPDKSATNNGPASSPPASE